jgi:hypothetical protein
MNVHRAPIVVQIKKDSEIPDEPDVTFQCCG